MRNVVPSGPVRSTAMRPPFAVRSSRAIVRPRPSPVARPVAGSVARDGVRTVEALEDVVDVARGDARALVGDADLDAVRRRGSRRPGRRRRPGCGRSRWRRRCGSLARGDRRPPRPTAPGATATSIRTDRARAGPSRTRAISGSASARSTRSGRAWSGAASARARSSMSATTPPSAAAAERAASSPAASVGTTPSIIAWSCDSRTVAGVARSWAMSLAARRRSISERSRRSAMALNASASSVDSRSSPPVARAPDLARLETPGRGGHVVERPRQPARDRRRDRDDGQDADEPGDEQRHVEQRQEPAVAGPRRAGPPRASRRSRRRPRSGPRSARESPAGARPNAASVVPSSPTTRISPPSDVAIRVTSACARARPAGSRQPVGEGDRRVVEALLLLAGQDGLEAAADDAIDDDPDEQQDAEHGDPEQEAEPPGERPPAGRAAPPSGRPGDRSRGVRRGDEPVAGLRDRLDEPRLGGVVAELAPQVRDVDVDDPVVDLVRPARDGLEQLVAGQDGTRPPGERGEQADLARRQPALDGTGAGRRPRA